MCQILVIQVSFNPPPPKGGWVNPQRYFCNNFLTEKDNEMKFWVVVNGLTANL